MPPPKLIVLNRAHCDAVIVTLSLPVLPVSVSIPETVPTEIGVRGLADVTQEMRGEVHARVGALGLHLDGHAGQVETPLFDARDLFEGQPA